MLLRQHLTDAGRGGAAVNVSSLAGVLGLSDSPGAMDYTTSKAGLQGFTLSVTADYAAEANRANCLIIGTVIIPLATISARAGGARDSLTSWPSDNGRIEAG